MKFLGQARTSAYGFHLEHDEIAVGARADLILVRENLLTALTALAPE